MDPNANLAEQLAIVARFYNPAGAGTVIDWIDEAERLSELVDALNEWLTRGGALPDAWAKGRQ